MVDKVMLPFFVFTVLSRLREFVHLPLYFTFLDVFFRYQHACGATSTKSSMKSARFRCVFVGNESVEVQDVNDRIRGPFRTSPFLHSEKKSRFFWRGRLLSIIGKTFAKAQYA